MSSCLFNLYAEYNVQSGRLSEAEDVIKIAGRNINNIRYADDTRKQRGAKEPLDENKRGE